MPDVSNPATDYEKTIHYLSDSLQTFFVPDATRPAGFREFKADSLSIDVPSQPDADHLTIHLESDDLPAFSDNVVGQRLEGSLFATNPHIPDGVIPDVPTAYAPGQEALLHQLASALDEADVPFGQRAPLLGWASSNGTFGLASVSEASPSTKKTGMRMLTAISFSDNAQTTLGTQAAAEVNDHSADIQADIVSSAAQLRDDQGQPVFSDEELAQLAQERIVMTLKVDPFGGTGFSLEQQDDRGQVQGDSVLSRLPLRQQEEIINNALVSHSPALYQLAATPERVRSDLETLSREYGLDVEPLLDSPLLVPQSERYWQPEILTSRRSEDGRTLELDVSLPEGVRAQEMFEGLVEDLASAYDAKMRVQQVEQEQDVEQQNPETQPGSQIREATTPVLALVEGQRAALATAATSAMQR